MKIKEIDFRSIKPSIEDRGRNEIDFLFKKKKKMLQEERQLMRFEIMFSISYESTNYLFNFSRSRQITINDVVISVLCG